MAKTCWGTAASDRKYIAALNDTELLEGLANHADPKWWKQQWVQNTNQGYLRRWGAYLRREARKRGLL